MNQTTYNKPFYENTQIHLRLISGKVETKLINGAKECHAHAIKKVHWGLI